MEPITEAVRERYARLAIQIKERGGGCCDCGCSEPAVEAIGPTGEQLYPASAAEEAGVSLGVSLGCGNPTALADLLPGETVLDLGSGAGLDVLLSARRVSPGGHAYGVDMTDEMLAVANANKAKAGVENATFLKGTIEQVPLPDNSVTSSSPTA
jgi:SAM-dependent methyltransferase